MNRSLLTKTILILSLIGGLLLIFSQEASANEYEPQTIELTPMGRPRKPRKRLKSKVQFMGFISIQTTVHIALRSFKK